MTRLQQDSHREQMDALREAFLREWNAEHRDLPDGNEKAMKCLRDWQEFLKTRKLEPVTKT